MLRPVRVVLASQGLAIAVLSVTACVLFVGLLLVMATPRPAYGFAMNDRGGDYIMLTEQIANNAEGLVVIDAAAKLMIVYAYDSNNNVLEILERVNLEVMPRPVPREAAPEAENAGRRR